MSKPNSQVFRLGELARIIGAELKGDADCAIDGLATLQDARPGQLSFLANPVYRKYLSGTGASAVILHPNMEEEFSGHRLLHGNPYVGFARLTALFDTYTAMPKGIHPTAVVDGQAQVSASAAIGPHVVIEAGARIGENAQIGAGSFIGRDSVIGNACRIGPGVYIYHGVGIGDHCVIHSSVVIGADGFGFAADKNAWVKVHQLGGVEIGNRVEIGAGTTIDRGALENTVIGEGVIIDNQVQIAHNVRIGPNTAIAGCTAIAGSTTIGANCTIAGGVGITGHLHIADNVLITAMTLVTKSIHKTGSYSSGTPLAITQEWRKNAVRFGQLDNLAARLKQLEKKRSE